MKKIFVGNLDFKATEDSIRSLFEQHGTVERVSLMTDRDTGRSRGFAFVEMTDSAEAERATRHLAAVGLPTRVQDIPGPLPSIDQLMELIAQDKKVKRGMLTFILVKGIGAAFVEGGVDAGAVRTFLGEKLAKP